MIRPALVSDIEDIMNLFEAARLDLRKQGIDQWQNGYPNQDSIIQDIANKRAYVLDETTIKGYAYIGTYEASYDVIEGAWLTHQSYLVMHRVVVDTTLRGQGLAGKLMTYAIERANAKKQSIRIDTHIDNKAMQALLRKWDFLYCGIITLEDGSKRLAYERIAL